ncbi:MAG: phospholipase [Acidobacteriota bacterium]
MTREEPQRLTVPALFHGACLLELGPSEEAPVVVGCHGYGETASDIFAELKRIPGSRERTLAAIEAPHPFYRRNGDVVRSWMTKVDRDLAVEDNVRYAGAVVSELRRQGARGRLVFAGFSQGVAMAWRAAVRSGFPCAGLIVLAGDVPPDIVALGPSALPRVLLGRGTEDSWYDEAKMEADLEVLGRLGAEVETCVFEGGHLWSDPFRAAAARFLAGIAS